MADLKGSKTEANLKAAFAGESQARNRYTFFAIKAKEEGFDNIANFFKEAAKNEREHARIWFKHLSGVGDTKANLQAAVEGEQIESGQMYPSFAETARKEGFDDIAKLFESVGNIEKEHAAKFLKMINDMQASKQPADETPIWKCKNCGHIIKAKNAPAACPVCGEQDIAWSGSKAFYQVKD